VHLQDIFLRFSNGRTDCVGVDCDSLLYNKITGAKFHPPLSHFSIPFPVIIDRRKCAFIHFQKAWPNFCDIKIMTCFFRKCPDAIWTGSLTFYVLKWCVSEHQNCNDEVRRGLKVGSVQIWGSNHTPETAQISLKSATLSNMISHVKPH